MAKGSVSPPDPPAKSEEESGEEESSSEEEVNAAGSETESVSESETESKQTDNDQPIRKPLSTPLSDAQTPDSSSEESDSESESASASDSTIKPIVSKPVDGVAQKKPISKPNTASLSSLSKKPNSAAGAKRPATSETGGDGEVTVTKRSKKNLKKDTEEPRKFYRRVWSEEDELALLNGMVDFSAIKKADPFLNIAAFHEFIKKSIHVDVRSTQLRDKIPKMRKKYSLNLDNEKQGEGKIFTNDHEQKVFELSKKVWGNQSFSAGRPTASAKNNGDLVKKSLKNNGDLVKRSSSKNMISKDPVNVDVGEDCAKGGISKGGLELDRERLKSVSLGAQKLGIEEWIMHNSIQLVDGENRAKMDEKWRRFRMEEAEIYSKKLELLLEEAKLVVDALRSSTD